MSSRFVDTHLSAPVNVTWEITLACNLRCRHCLSAAGPKADRELDTGEAIGLVDTLHRMGVFQVNFGGGEPFLRPDFEQILGACHERGMVTCISTNGTLLDPSLVDRLARSGMVAIQVSLDGARAATCDAIRGNGAFARATEALRLLAATPIPTSINAVLTAINAAEIPELYDMARSLGVSLRVSRFRPSGRGAQAWEALRPGPRQLLAFGEWLARQGDVRTGDSFFSLTPQERMGLGLNLCGAAKFTCCVGPEGEVFPCAFLQRPEFRAGSVRREPFDRIWRQAGVFQAFRRLRVRSCESCHRFDRCHGGCPAVAYHLAGDPGRGDPECLERCVAAVAPGSPEHRRTAEGLGP